MEVIANKKGQQPTEVRITKVLKKIKREKDKLK